MKENNTKKSNGLISQVVISLGLISIIALLFNTNRMTAAENRKLIAENRENFYEIDKKIDLLQMEINHKLEILLLSFEDKYPSAVEKAKEKVNNNHNDTIPNDSL